MHYGLKKNSYNSSLKSNAHKPTCSNCSLQCFKHQVQGFIRCLKNRVKTATKRNFNYRAQRVYWKYITWLRRPVSDENKSIIWGRTISLFASGRSWESARQAPTFTGGGLLTEQHQHMFIPLSINMLIYIYIAR